MEFELFGKKDEIFEGEVEFVAGVVVEYLLDHFFDYPDLFFSGHELFFS